MTTVGHNAVSPSPEPASTEHTPLDWVDAMTRFDRDGDTFWSRDPEAQGGRLFGGLVAAQALAAGAHTVADEKRPQSLHAYFVRAGRPGIDIAVEVERTRDGRSFDTRRVTATQGDEVILELLSSFHRSEVDVDTHPPAPPSAGWEKATTVDGPGDLSSRFELRSARGSSSFSGPPYWLRFRDTIADTPLVRACAVTYISDMGLMAAARPPGTVLAFQEGSIAASLDHAVWFHRPFDPSRWHRYEAENLNNNDSRGLARGALYDQDSRLIASMVQEALWRTPAPEPSPSEGAPR